MAKISRPLRIILSTNIFVLIAGAMLAPIYAVYVDNIGGDLLDAGIAAALFAAAAGVTSLISGAYADKVKHKHRLVGIGYMLTGVGFVAHIFVGSVWQLFAAQVFIGLVQASYEPVFDGLYTKFIGSVKKASSRWGMWEAGNYFSIAIGSVAGAAVVAYAGFAAMFALMALLCFASGLYLLAAGKRLRL
jgi:predicted MFS family arabinose efflux permease